MALKSIGLEPIFIVKVGSTYFAKQELSSEETATFDNLTSDPIVEGLRGSVVYAGILSIGSCTLSNSERGFGSVGSISVSFLDYSGYFKNLIETNDLYDLEVYVLLYFRQRWAVTSLHDQCMLRITGKFQAPIEWSEDSRTLSTQIVSNVIFKEFGFTPEFENIDHIRENMVGQN